MQKYTNAIQDVHGNAVAGATIAVYLYGTLTPATIYSDNGSTVIASSSVTSDSTGEFYFYAANGRYTLSVSAPQFASEQVSDVYLYDPTVANVVDKFTATAGQTVFTLSNAPGDIDALLVALNGSVLTPDVDFTLSGVTLTLVVAAAAGDYLVSHYGLPTSQQVIAAGVVTDASVSSSSKLYNRINDTFSVKDYGAVGDGVTSDKTAINAAIAAAQAAGGGEVYFPEGTYLITGGITPSWTGNSDRDGLLITGNNITLTGAGPGTILKQDSTNQNLLALDGTAAQIAHITIRNIRFDGPTARHVMTSTADIYQRIHLIKAVNVFNVNIADCVFYAFQGDGIDFDGGFHGEGAPPYATTRHNVNLYIDNCIFDGFDNNNRNGVSVIDGDNVFVSNNTFRRIAKQYMPGSFDIEPNPYPYYITRNIYVTNNSFNNCQGSNGHLGYFIPSSSYPVTDPPQNFVFSGNTFTGTGTGIYGNCRDDINLGVLISDSVYRGSGRPFLFGYNSGAISYINGVTIDGNNFYYTTSSGVPFLGYKDAHEDVVKNIIFSNNMVASNGTGLGMRLGGSLEDVVINGNIFNNTLDYGALTGATSGSAVAYIRRVSFVGNQFTSIAGTAFSISTQLNTNPDAATCVWNGNRSANYANDCRFPASQFLDYATASPTNGRYAVGAVVRNIAPTAGNSNGWVCTVAGQPGTWVSQDPSYDAGTWTPVLTGSTSGTLTGTGSYVKIGKLVHLYCSFETVTTANKPIGNYTVTGVPAVAQNSTADETYAVADTYRVTFVNGGLTQPIFGRLTSTAPSTITLKNRVSGGNDTDVTDAQFVNASTMYLWLRMTYQVA